MSGFFASLAMFAIYFVGAAGLCLIYALVYLRLTPHDEFRLLTQEHNASAAIALGGSVVGFAIALAAAIRETHGLLEFLVWGVTALLSQIVAYFVAQLGYPDMSKAIASNAVAAAIWLASVSIASGVITAACMT